MREIRRGEIYFVDLNPIKGREQAGTRPVLVLSIDAINKQPLVVVTVVVGTKGERVPKDYPTNVRVSPQESGLPNGNGVSLLSNPFIRSRPISRPAQRQGLGTNFI